MRSIRACVGRLGFAAATIGRPSAGRQLRRPRFAIGFAFAGLAFAGLAFAGLAFAGVAFAGLAFAFAGFTVDVALALALAGAAPGAGPARSARATMIAWCAGLTGCTESRAPRCRSIMLASPGCARSSASGTKRGARRTYSTSTQIQRGASALLSGS
jgi:hypothetical protein